MNAKDDSSAPVVVPLCLRAVVVTALVSQTRGSLAFLGFGARTLVSTLGDAACPFARVKGSSKPLRRVAPALEVCTRVGIVMVHLSVKAFGRQRRAVGDTGVPRRLVCSWVRKVGEGRLCSYSCMYWVY